MKTDGIKNFREFLQTYLEEDSPLGDLARDSFSNPFWRGTTINSLKKQLKDLHACNGAWKALNEAIRLYEPKTKFTKICFMTQKNSDDPKIINYVIKAFRSYNIEITAEDGEFKVNPNSAEQERLVSLLCADLGLGILMD